MSAAILDESSTLVVVRRDLQLALLELERLNDVAATQFALGCSHELMGNRTAYFVASANTKAQATTKRAVITDLREQERVLMLAVTGLEQWA